MFRVARDAGADVGMKRSRLPLKDGCGIGVTDNAARGFNTHIRRVARCAPILQKRVRSSQRSRRDNVLPRHSPIVDFPAPPTKKVCGREESYERQRSDKTCPTQLHGTHRSPK